MCFPTSLGIDKSDYNLPNILNNENIDSTLEDVESINKPTTIIKEVIQYGDMDTHLLGIKDE